MESGPPFGLLGARGSRVCCLKDGAALLPRERLLRGRNGVTQASTIGVIAPAPSGQPRLNAPRECYRITAWRAARYVDPEPVLNTRDVREVSEQRGYGQVLRAKTKA
ncbi:MAG: hypothetical protein ABW318_15390 [Vicinamibacterales bacterium]